MPLALLAAALFAQVDAGAPPRPAVGTPQKIAAPSPRQGGKAEAKADPKTALLQAARRMLGLPYRFGGRGQGDIDCLGLVLLAAQEVSGCSWRSFAYNPTDTVARRELGEKVGGLSPISTAALAGSAPALREGDVIFFVGFDENPAEPKVATLDGKSVWVWHVGLYAGDGRFVVGDHYAGAAVELSLEDYLEAHADVYAGIYVLRMRTGEGPSPPRCRKVAPSDRLPVTPAASRRAR